jgi:hypothetical protein
MIQFLLSSLDCRSMFELITNLPQIPPNSLLLEWFHGERLGSARLPPASSGFRVPNFVGWVAFNSTLEEHLDYTKYRWRMDSLAPPSLRKLLGLFIMKGTALGKPGVSNIW